MPSLAYALFYIALIPSFAALYYFALPNDFYHATAQFERGPMNHAASQILSSLRESILKQMEAGGSESHCQAWRIDRGRTVASGFQVNDESFSFTLRIVMWGTKEPVKRVQEIHPMKLSFSLQPQVRTWTADGRSETDYFEVRPPESTPPLFDGQVSSQDLISCVFQLSRSESMKVPSLKLPGGLTADITRFGAAKGGFPSQIEGQFVRMLYLSASTITTLGYGDIVPLTTSARLAVSAEAVLGILVVGLFLNAVAKEQ